VKISFAASRTTRATAGFMLTVLVAACGSGGLSAPVGVPVPDPAAFAASVRDATIPETPRQLSFRWTLDEQGSRVSGRGVVRSVAPERIRLDLFGERGDTYLIAALVGDEYRLPPEAVNAVTLPSPTLLWAALGVLQSPAGSTLLSATASDELAELRYSGSQDEVYAYTFSRSGDSFALTRLERAGARGVVETVSVEYASGSADPARISYRDWTAFRDLNLSIDEVRGVASFPTGIWRPDVR